MNIDALLNESAPALELTAREKTHLDELIDQSLTVRSPGRRARIVTSVASAIAIFFAGGVSAAAAAGILHPGGYSSTSDWATQIKTVNRVFVVGGQRHSCIVSLSVEVLGNDAGSPEYQEALRYVQGWNPLRVAPDPTLITQFEAAGWSPSPTPAQANEMAWDSAVGAAFYAHLKSSGVDPSSVSMLMPTTCDFDR